MKTHDKDFFVEAKIMYKFGSTLVFPSKNTLQRKKAFLIQKKIGFAFYFSYWINKGELQNKGENE